MAFTFRLAAQLAVCFADTETQPYRWAHIGGTIFSIYRLNSFGISTLSVCTAPRDRLDSRLKQSRAALGRGNPS